MLCEQTFELGSLTKNIAITSTKGSLDLDIKGIAYDSKHVRPGFLFVAMKGLQHHGDQFIDEAISRGAIAIISDGSQRKHKNITQINVKDARQALATIACTFHHEPSEKLKAIGITGTNGKTTVSFLAKAVLEKAGMSPGLVGTVRYEVGQREIPASRTTPESSDLQNLLDQMVHAGCKSVIMEVSSHALVQNRVHGIDFDVAVFTNLTQDHLDYHESMDNYFEAKAKLFANLGRYKKKTTAVINVDDPWGAKLIRAEFGGSWPNEITYGEHPNAMVRMEHITLSKHGSQFNVISPWGNLKLSFRLLGKFNISNALAAIAACCALNIPMPIIAESLESFATVPGRLEEIHHVHNFRVFVDYAHSPDALGHVLHTLRDTEPHRLIVVFGCGGNRDKQKRKLMGEIASSLADFIILTSDNPRTENPADIIEQIRSGLSDTTHYIEIENREAAIQKAIEIAEENDVVLIAGKGHENYQEFANTIIPFDDRDVARKWLSTKQSV